MQLVLGAQMGANLETAGTPRPAPEPRFRLGERGRRALRRAAWLAAFTLLVALGALQGATVAIGADGVSELTGAEPRPVQEPAAPEARAAAEPRGVFWRPERSRAARPPAEIKSRRWYPHERD
ncbi:MAG TPA: hypothetical protein VII78_09360 [Myxococcota bacterium]|jgi:hypothetical protein